MQSIRGQSATDTAQIREENKGMIAPLRKTQHKRDEMYRECKECVAASRHAIVWQNSQLEFTSVARGAIRRSLGNGMESHTVSELATDMGTAGEMICACSFQATT